MFQSLKSFIDLLARPAAPAAARPAHDLQLATAVLLVEVMRADAGLAESERQAAMDTLQRQFALTPDDVDRLMDLAHDQARAAHDLHSFTSALNAHYTMQDRIAVVEALWQVAFADGHLAAHEQHILWRVADLLHVPHGAYIHAKLRARQAAGLTD